MRLFNNVIRFTEKLRHAVHIRKGQPRACCIMCSEQPENLLRHAVTKLVQRAASREAEANFGRDKLNRACTLKDGVWYSTTRLDKEGMPEIRDMDTEVFFDGQSIKKVLPVVLVESPIFAALLQHVHEVVTAHAGVEATLRRIRESFAPVGGRNVRAAITALRKRCAKCRRNLKILVDKELADFPLCRTAVAPPFYYMMMDIAMAFKAKPYKDARRTMPAHALVMVCLLSSATDIMVIDGLSTQAVVLALQRHAARYGMPAEIYVDPGTQLHKLNDAFFDLRDVNHHVFQDQRFKVTTSAPKAHQAQGRVERRIRTIRDMLQRLFDTTDLCDTLLGWETVFAGIASQVDDVPIARGSASAPSDLGWEIITPNRLKLGRNNFRSLEGQVKLDFCPQSQLERNRDIMRQWHQIFMERVQLLVPAPSKVEGRDVEVGDVVLFVFSDGGSKRDNVWKLGKVVEVVSGTTIKIQYSLAGIAPKTMIRSIRSVVIVLTAEEISTGSE
jgi:hypothetical protein